MNKRAVKPDFHKALSEPGFYAEANRQVKYQESDDFWVFKTGDWVYKVKKRESSASGIALEEAFCSEMVAQAGLHSPGLETSVLRLVETDGHWHLKESAPLSEVRYLVLKQRQLIDKGFVDHMLEKGQLKSKHVAQIAQALWRFHSAEGPKTPPRQPGPAELQQALANGFYQSKKFLGIGLTKPMIDRSTRPLEKYLEDHKKIFNRRLKRGFVGHYHGLVEPRKIHWTPQGVNFLNRGGDPIKDRHGDRASDLAQFMAHLIHLGKDDLAQAFYAEYLALSADKELAVVIPFYQALCCLNTGHKHQQAAAGGEADAALETQKAKAWFEQVVAIAVSL
ncbi:MAG: hypothetical protein A2508_00865 [Candidatus Lambdaproteobacteria bacterium RIFOXYD12_FULL_49_8]|uniref:Aminoglycoside phosphotransferase domain-containing protein n=1 Tax=Candidatus Lambdaproteobacteria bacterium RIFOXYD2_FULL_50_16 TaxID=1817772 RepID=A0A1F6GFU9_9PROT|nr:MAG: hypothetical protein A2508_00865 [Candidatus Lambdaproteobacteria bacterium RIFOXYD12_FULL_49_8]OGG96975.1 MAG: hypothetical protein A2527_02655 [Candidatus Lambdaproteobacteria bacterium RIFOXYD2_FULL_50_16]